MCREMCKDAEGWVRETQRDPAGHTDGGEGWGDTGVKTNAETGRERERYQGKTSVER